MLDTHLLLWLAYTPELFSRRANDLFADLQNTYLFSAVSIWEVAIKQRLRKPGFDADPARVREGLLAGGLEELTIQSSHAIAVAHLPLLHRDPFDRLLVAQALVEDLVFATVDKALTQYASSVIYVG